jgi:apolipoprotein N-acyltransferase
MEAPTIEDEPTPRPNAFLDETSAAVAQTIHVADAALVLLRAELRLARGSVLTIGILAVAVVFLAIAAWLATCAAIAVGVFELTGSLILGLASVALANAIGLALTLPAMRRCWTDVSLPRTRKAIGALARVLP